MNNLSFFIRIGLALGAVLLISLLFPDFGYHKYSYSVGKAWNYEDLYAIKDYAILKDISDVEVEKNKFIKNKELVFSKDNEALEGTMISVQNSIDTYIEDADNDITKQSILLKTNAWYYAKSKHIIKSVLKRGIVEIHDTINRADIKVITLIEGNTSRSISLDNLLTMDQANRQISKYLAGISFDNTDFLLPIILRHLNPNVHFDSQLTNNFLQEKISNIALTNGVVKSGDRIVAKGEIVNKKVYQKIFSYVKHFEQDHDNGSSKWMLFIGYFLLTFLIIGVLLIYLKSFYSEIFNNWKELTFLLMWFVLLSYLVFQIEAIDAINIYIIPFCIAPIIIKNFYNTRLALFVHVLIILLASFLSSLGYEFTFLQIFAGIVAILLASETREWTEFFKSILFIFLAYLLGYIGLTLIQGDAITDIDFGFIVWFLLNALFLLLTYPLIPLIERLFGFTSSISLVELSDLNRPLLKKLSLHAPGTLQHSLQVANLAEAAADKIGANSLLVKVAALYHDIGKTLHPEYFIENQNGGNPHEEMNPLESAQKIIEHVTEGEKMALKARLPKIIINFIVTHHGNTRVEYFYQKQLEDLPKGEVDESLFRYPGPKPVSKEETILMIADSIEAASKSLKNPTADDINDLFDSIVKSKIDQGQFENSKLSFGELEEVVTVIKSILKSIYHIRIKYPGQK